MICPDTDRFFPRVREVVAADGNRLPVNFVGVAGVVTQAVDHQRQVGIAALGDRLAVVERFQRGKVVDLLFHQIGQLVHDRPAVAGVHRRPGAALKGVAGCFDRQLDVFLVPFGDGGDHLFGGRIDRLERLAARRGHPASADEAIGLLDLGRGDRFGDSGHGSSP